MMPANSENVTWYDIGVTEAITPEHPLPAPPSIPRGGLVIVTGRAPVWRYAMACHELHGSPAGAVATYDPRLGAIVVYSHQPTWRTGQVLDVQCPA